MSGNDTLGLYVSLQSFVLVTDWTSSGNCSFACDIMLYVLFDEDL